MYSEKIEDHRSNISPHSAPYFLKYNHVLCNYKHPVHSEEYEHQAHPLAV